MFSILKSVMFLFLLSSGRTSVYMRVSNKCYPNHFLCDQNPERLTSGCQSNGNHNLLCYYRQQ